MWGVVLGAVGGIPISGLVFILLHLGFCNPARKKGTQLFLGGVMGIVAFELSAASASLMGAWGKTTLGHNENYPLIGFASAYAVFAILSVLYARSSPHRHLS